MPSQHWLLVPVGRWRQLCGGVGLLPSEGVIWGIGHLSAPETSVFLQPAPILPLVPPLARAGKTEQLEHVSRYFSEGGFPP